MTERPKQARHKGEAAGLPAPSRGVLSDLRFFVLHRPAVATLIDSRSQAGREKYSDRIRQRLGVSVADYAILNIHRIGIDAPARDVFEEIAQWRAADRCWPRHLAKLERPDGCPEDIHVFLLGRKKRFLGLKSKFFGLNVVPLFRMESLKVQRVPGPSDVDDARYLLYRCRGGYPVGIFFVYVRSPLASEGAAEKTHVYIVVGFNFYGQKDWPSTHFVNKAWELIHNRVMANILNRLKQLCEARVRDAPAPR